jgi:hypothetical protein
MQQQPIGSKYHSFLSQKLACGSCMRLLLPVLSFTFSFAKVARLSSHRGMLSASASPQIISNVTSAAIASFPPDLTICISNARDVSAAKLNDVRY